MYKVVIYNDLAKFNFKKFNKLFYKKDYTFDLKCCKITQKVNENDFQTPGRL